MMTVRLHILSPGSGCKLMILQQVFDHGEYKDQPDKAHRIMESLMETMRGNPKTGNKLKIVQAHDTVVFRMARVRSKNQWPIICVFPLTL